MAIPTRARGTEDVGPEEMERRLALEAAVLEAFASFGYRRVQVPCFEGFALYEARYGPEVRSRLFTFQHEREEALRPDLTAGIARFVASGALDQGSSVLRLSAAGPCFRYLSTDDEPRLRQFHQAGVEMFGAPPPRPEVELTLLAARVIEAAAIDGAVVTLGHAGLTRGIIGEHLGDRAQQVVLQLDHLFRIEQAAREGDPAALAVRARRLLRFADAMRGVLQWRGEDDRALAAAVERLEAATAAPPVALAEAVAGAARTLYRLRWRRIFELDDRACDSLLALARLTGERATVREGLEELFGAGAVAARAAELDEILDLLERASDGGGLRVEIAPAASRGLEYYTGLIIEVTAPGHGELCGGGRYDRLVADVGGAPRPACGLAVWLERLAAASAAALRKPGAGRGTGGRRERLARVAVLEEAGERCLRRALAIADRLRQAGFVATIDPFEPDGTPLAERARAASAADVVVAVGADGRLAVHAPGGAGAEVGSGELVDRVREVARG